MSRNRVEAFSDGVVAIIITIMVLELRAPIGASLSLLRPLTPVFLSYILSFVLVGIYWSNHHHLFQVVERVSGGVLWANLHLLFWLSDSVRHCLDGSEPLRGHARRGLWGRIGVRGHCVFHFDASAVTHSHAGFDPRNRTGQRFQGQDFNCDLSRGDQSHLRETVVGSRSVC